jgi:hypothetical protein
MERNTEKVEVNYGAALKVVKVEAFGIFITMFLSFCCWPAIIFSCNVNYFLKF